MPELTAEGAREAASTAREFEADVRVEAKTVAADGVVLLELRPVDGEPLPTWEPGAHVDLILGAAPTRQYSLCGDPAERDAWRIGVLREADGRGSSRHVHDVMQAGDIVRVRGPRNSFALEPAPAYLFIAGGIGVTPILPMIRAAESAGAEWRLVYGGRRRESMAFLAELAAYGSRVSVRPQDETGLLDLDEILDEPRADTLIYSCGPEPLLAAIESKARSWPTSAVRMERFAPKPVDEQKTNEAFEIELAQTGVTLAVGPDQSVLGVLEDAGVDVFSSCGEGTCGTCEVRVLAGRPDHRDSVLGPAERESNTCMMVCVSRSLTGRLTLDL